MKKFILVFAILSVLLLAGCGGEPSGASSEVEQPQGLETEGTFIGSASLE